jgi:hypothetical protein
MHDDQRGIMGHVGVQWRICIGTLWSFSITSCFRSALSKLNHSSNKADDANTSGSKKFNSAQSSWRLFCAKSDAIVVSGEQALLCRKQQQQQQQQQ